MASLREEIRHQPLWVRQVMFGFSVIAALSLVGGIWFRSFEKDMFALLNPDPAVQEQHFAQFKTEEGAFSLASKAIEGLRATISDFFGFDTVGTKIPSEPEDASPHALPLSE
ncbi:MAG: hypothetical protein KW806_02025 [Candidatus Yanofskybacteria bacterium]|nr:hypothetical protein [Candidatus Yanofskybacteria bacterium]